MLAVEYIAGEINIYCLPFLWGWNVRIGVSGGGSERSSWSPLSLRDFLRSARQHLDSNNTYAIALLRKPTCYAAFLSSVPTTMTSRKAACDPCRQAKLACDHRQPICTRCERRKNASSCVYRAAPFKRARADSHATASTQRNTPNARSTRRHGDRSVNTTPLRRPLYPNPGHLGPSSHIAIFNQISPREGNRTQDSLPARVQDELSDPVEPDTAVNHVARMLERLLDEYDIGSLAGLVKTWLARGTNLALAEPFVLHCTESAEPFLRSDRAAGPNAYTSLVQRLVKNSTVSLLYTKSSTFSQFISQFCGQFIRLETIGIFLCAVIRATIDIPFFPPLYSTEVARHRFRQLATALNNSALEVCLSLDCLNDLQLIFQYEQWIVLSHAHGDHSRMPSSSAL